MADVSECLRTYDSLGLWRDAEEVLRRDVVHDFVKKVYIMLTCKIIMSLTVLIPDNSCQFANSSPQSNNAAYTLPSYSPTQPQYYT